MEKERKDGMLISHLLNYGWEETLILMSTRTLQTSSLSNFLSLSYFLSLFFHQHRRGGGNKNVLNISEYTLILFSLSNIFSSFFPFLSDQTIIMMMRPPTLSLSLIN